MRPPGAPSLQRRAAPREHPQGVLFRGPPSSRRDAPQAGPRLNGIENPTRGYRARRARLASQHRGAAHWNANQFLFPPASHWPPLESANPCPTTVDTEP